MIYLWWIPNDCYLLIDFQHTETGTTTQSQVTGILVYWAPTSDRYCTKGNLAQGWEYAGSWLVATESKFCSGRLKADQSLDMNERTIFETEIPPRNVSLGSKVGIRRSESWTFK
jgi:hypothetical protein